MAVRRKREQESDIQKAAAERVRETGGIYAVVSDAKAARAGASRPMGSPRRGGPVPDTWLSAVGGACKTTLWRARAGVIGGGLQRWR